MPPPVVNVSVVEPLVSPSTNVLVNESPSSSSSLRKGRMSNEAPDSPSSNNSHSSFFSSVRGRKRNAEDHPWFHNVTRAEKVLSLSMIFLLMLLLFFFIVILYLVSGPSHKISWHSFSGPSTQDPCLTPLCVAAAADIMKRIDESIDPCDDFYRFSCGGLDNKMNLIPEDKSSLSTASLLQADIDQKIRVLLEDIEEKDESHYLAKMKTFYDKCMDVAEHESLGDEPLKEVLAEIGGWPVVSRANWTEGNFSLEETLIKLKQLGFRHDMFATIEIAPHVLAHKYNLIYIGSADLGLDDRSYYLDPMYNETMNAYLKFMVTAAQYLGASESEAKEHMNQVLEFEKKIAQLMTPRDFRSNILNYHNLSMIDELAPFLNWTNYLNGVFSPHIYIPDAAFFVVKNPSFLSNISQLVQETDQRTLANYVGWRMVMESTSILSDKWSQIGRKLWIKLDGRPKLKTKWSYCVSLVKKYFEFGASALYVQNVPEDEQIQLVRTIVEYIRSAFKQTLRSNNWMDEETKKEAIAKTDKIQLHVGFPVQLLNNTAVNEVYELALINSTWSYYLNTLMIRRWRTNHKYQKVQFDNEKGHWHEYGKVAEVNAYYRTQENSIEFPLSIIKAMQIHRDKPMYLNFGDIGWVVGHEITHGFDNQGRHFDGDGEYRSWWSNETDAEYEERAKCFTNQYSRYNLSDSDQQINGNLTLGENIADNGGLKEAFNAYREHEKDHGVEPTLPGLKYSPQQLFFIQSASFYCGKFRKELTEYGLKTDGHAPNKYRIIGSMSNSREFSEVFKCKAGAPMNPISKCSLW